METRTRAALYLGGLILSGTLAAQSVVKDINTVAGTVPSSSPTNMLTVGATTYFAANNVLHGSELWKTDGTAAGTVMVKDINPGSSSSSPASLTLFNGLVYFSATDANGSELWRTDGTAAGTVLVADCYPGSGAATPSNLVVNGATMFFSAFDGTATVGSGRELWKTDGTTAGTVRITDLIPGTTSSILSTAASSYAAFGPGLLFPASNSTTAPGTGEELYYTDGTTAGTVQVLDIFPGTSSGAPRFLTPFGGRVYFTATNGTAVPANGVELWVTDGTAAGTTMVIDIYAGTSGSIPSQPIVSNGKLFFSANNGAATGRELYVSDGTTAGTVLVKDTNPGTASGIASQTLNIMVPFGTGVLVGMTDGSVAPATGEELWFSDGTLAGTVLVSDINTGTVSSTPRAARVAGGRVFFAATTATTGYEMFVTDGTPAGTALTRDIGPGTTAGVLSTVPSAERGTSLVFAASDTTTPPGVGTELWISDGTLAGTVLLKDIAVPQPGSSNPVNFAAFGNRTVFGATDGTSGVEPWITDGTAAGTVQLADIFPGTSSSSPANFTVFGNRCYFTASSGTTAPGTGVELYVTDGTPAGTQLLLDINPGTVSSSPLNLVVSNGKLFFSALTAAAGRELWVSDGTTPGTTMVVDFKAGTESGSAGFGQAMIAFGNGVMFSGNNVVGGTEDEICVSDGTAAGTVLIDFVPGPAVGCVPSPFIVLGNYAYCNATDGVNGYELIRSDGTLAGTSMVKDIVPGAGEGNPGPFAVLNNRLYFYATDPASGTELWVSDGTAAGTVQLADINPGTASALSNSPFAANLVVAGGRMFFPANNGTNGIELWSSDGTTPGTTLARDLNPGAANGMLSLTAIPYAAGVGTKVLFSGDDGSGGLEPCLSNGTLAGTNVIADLFPGSTASAPTQYLVNSLAKAVYFAALDPTVGREPFSVSTTTIGASLAEVFGVGCPGTGGLVPRIGFTGAPAIGTTFGVTLSNALASTPCLLFIHAARSDLPLPGGCIVYPLQPAAIDVWSSTNLAGATTLLLPLPGNPSLVGLELFMQWTAFDPQGSYANFLSFSNGLRAVIGQP